MAIAHCFVNTIDLFQNQKKVDAPIRSVHTLPRTLSHLSRSVPCDKNPRNLHAPHLQPMIILICCWKNERRVAMHMLNQFSSEMNIG